MTILDNPNNNNQRVKRAVYSTKQLLEQKSNINITGYEAEGDQKRISNRSGAINQNEKDLDISKSTSFSSIKQVVEQRENKCFTDYVEMKRSGPDNDPEYSFYVNFAFVCLLRFVYCYQFIV